MKLGSFCTEVIATTPVQHYIEIEATEDARLQAAHNLDKYHAATKSWRDSKVAQNDNSPGDIVLIRHQDKQGKLQSQWYGPFILASKIKPGTYRFLNNEGVETTHA